MRTQSVLAFFCGCLLLPLTFFVTSSTATANTEVERLQAQIEERNTRLTDIESEIKEYELALQEVGAEKDTLQNKIKQLRLERDKVQADISYTQNKIDATDLAISKLQIEIAETEEKITTSKATIAAILRRMDQADDEPLVEILLRQQRLTDFWSELEALETVKASMTSRIENLDEQKTTLEKQKELSAQERNSLESLKNQYDDQRSILVSNETTQANLLQVTKNEEASYQQLLEQKKVARDQLLAEVRDIETQIKFILDPNTIPAAGTAVFQWPVANPYITQYFGYTRFALSGAYNGNAHNGMDLGAPVGTKIYAPLTGTVRNVGNTDLVPGCYSWGKWILIDHPNGLSTMYAHLSQAAVSPGQKVKTGDVIGYIGNTGYSTGPHLHFTLYVSDGVQVQQFNQFKSVTSCGAALSPFAAVEAYLDPLDYLPPL